MSGCKDVKSWGEAVPAAYAISQLAEVLGVSGMCGSQGHSSAGATRPLVCPPPAQVQTSTYAGGV
jgi:hypothetical protein